MMTEGEKMVWAATFVHVVGLSSDMGVEDDNLNVTAMAVKLARLQVLLLRKAAKAAMTEVAENDDPEWKEAMSMAYEMAGETVTQEYLMERDKKRKR